MKPIRRLNLPKGRSVLFLGFFFLVFKMISKPFLSLYRAVQFVYEVNVSTVLQCIEGDFSVLG